MSLYRNFDFFTVAPGTSSTVTTVASTSQGAALPNTSGGSPARFTRFSTTARCYVRVGNGAQTATTSDIAVEPGAPIVLNTQGRTNYAVIDNGAAATVTITPLEDS